MIKALFKRVGEYKKQAILAPILVTLEVVLEVLIPLLLARLLDNGVTAGNMGYVGKMGGLLAGCALASLLLGAFSGRFAAIASAGFAKNLRRDLFTKVQSFSLQQTESFSAGSLVTRLTTDVSNVQNAFQMVIRVAVRAPVMLLFALVMAFFVNAKLSLLYLGAVPLLGVGLYFIMRGAHPIFRRVFATYDTLNRVVSENLRAIRVVKSFVREEDETEKFRTVSGAIARDFSKAEKLLAFNSPLVQFAMYATTLLLSWFGAELITAREMSTGQLAALFSYTLQILFSLNMLSMVFVMLTLSRASVTRIHDVLRAPGDLPEQQTALQRVAEGSVEFKRVGFSYAEGPLALQNLSLCIKSGQTVGILGGTGAGKTTLMQLITRLYDASEGQVLVGGHNVKEYSLAALRQSIGMVPQQNILFTGTIRENLLLGNEHATDADLSRACRLAQAEEFILSPSFPDGYQTLLQEGGSNLSGGQRQRLCIARALVRKPKILILDDSTSALDARTDAALRKALQEETHTTKLIVTQRVASVTKADFIVVLDNGSIQATGTHAQLLQASGLYREIVHSQQKE